VTFRSSGFDSATISLDAIAVNFIRAGSPGRLGALARYSLAEPARTTPGLSGSSTHTFLTPASRWSGRMPFFGEPRCELTPSM
jgi:hypothetical protein